jgi:hypothetical protein
MGWQDDFGFLSAALQIGYIGSAPRASYQQPFRPAPGAKCDPWDVSCPDAPRWLDFATGRAGGTRPDPPPRSVSTASPGPRPRRPNDSTSASPTEGVPLRMEGCALVATPRTPAFAPAERAGLVRRDLRRDREPLTRRDRHPTERVQRKRSRVRSAETSTRRSTSTAWWSV